MNEVEKITNFQKIKSMDIDEMAKWITTMVNFDCYDCNNTEKCNDCFEMNKQWLKLEVRE